MFDCEGLAGLAGFPSQAGLAGLVRDWRGFKSKAIFLLAILLAYFLSSTFFHFSFRFLWALIVGLWSSA